MSFFQCMLFFGILSLLYFYWKYRKACRYFDQNDIPYTKPNLIFGNLTEVIFGRKSMIEILREFYENFQAYKIVGIFTMERTIVMIRDPILIKRILSKDTDYFMSQAQIGYREVDRGGLAGMIGKQWKTIRVKVMNTFTMAKMEIMFPLLSESGQRLSNALVEFDVRESFNVMDLCTQYMLDSVLNCTFGMRTHILDDPAKQENRNLMKMARELFKIRPIKILIRAIFPDLSTFLIKLLNLQFVDKKAEAFFKPMIENEIKRRNDIASTRGDFLDLFLTIKNRDRDGEITTDFIITQCFNFINGDLGPASQTLSLLLLELAKNQHIQNRARHEIRTTLHNEELTKETCARMVYTDMVIDEIFRKYPSSGLMLRKCKQDYQLPGSKTVLKKGVVVIIPMYGLHMDEKYYEKANDFYPEHFTEEAKQNRPKNTYIPFGAGPRSCIAYNFVKLQIKVAVVHLLRDFSFHLSPRTKLPVKFESKDPSVLVKGKIWLRCEKN